MHTTNGINTHNGHEFVDLGLPSGTLWATCNVGATSPEQAGLYFAWGETTGYTAEQVKSGERSFFLKDYVDNITSSDLTLEQDATHVYMGGEWRMPTKAECQELIDNCNVVWTDDYNDTGVKGRVFTSKVNGNSVFLPAAGVLYETGIHDVNSYGEYWCKNFDTRMHTYSIYFHKRLYFMSPYPRYYGITIRGVLNNFFYD